MPHKFNQGKYRYRVEEVREEYLESNGVVSACVRVCLCVWVFGRLGLELCYEGNVGKLHF